MKGDPCPRDPAVLFPAKGASYGSYKDMNLKSRMHDVRAVREERSGLSAYQANFKQR